MCNNVLLFTGTSASDMHFQAYLLEGLVRWNEDRASSAVTGGTSSQQQQSYSGILKHAVNKLSEEVLGEQLVPGYQQPRKYTGKFNLL